jgi:hypothetical protein
MSPEFEHVEVRTDQRVVSNAARFEDGTVFVPNCQIEEGDEIEVGGEKRRVTRCKPHELRHRTGMLDETVGRLLTLEATGE